MSKERQRTRAAREADKAARAAVERQRVARERAARPPAPQTRKPPRQRRFDALPLNVKLLLALGYGLVQFVAWQLLEHPAQRLGIALLSLLALPLAVVLTRPPR